VRFVAAERGPKRVDTGAVALVADHDLSEVPRPEVVLVPGGRGTREGDHAELLDWLRSAHEASRFTTSVCTGSLLLGAAGILDGLRATSHWLYLERLRTLGADPVAERVVTDGKVVTAAGVSSGIDMGLQLAGHIAGEQVARAIQLAIEYDPQPPFDSGSPHRAGDPLVELVRGAAREAGEV
jgi:transcriptional regulator GlxA family with amidase domain